MASLPLRVIDVKSTTISHAALHWNELGTPVSEFFGDVYFSNDNGLAETRYVFLEGNQLSTRLTQTHNDTFTLAETGFGTGLNFLTLWQSYQRLNCEDNVSTLPRLHFISCEKYPLTLLDLQLAHQHWPELASFSEALCQQWIRLAYLVAPSSLIPSLVNARQSMDGHTSPLMQAVTAKFINEGYFANHLRLMKILYAARRRLLIDLLDHSPPDTLRLFPSQGGLQLAVEYLLGDTTAITLAAARQGLHLTELAPLCLNSPPLQGWILGFSALTPQAMRHAVTLLNQILQNVASQR